jgi:hypothetical protein
VSASASEIREWALAHEARYEVDPLVEMVRGRRLHVGFTVSVFARFPVGDGPGEAREAAAAAIRAKLEEVLRSLAPAPGSPGRMEIEPARAAALFSNASDFEPEIAVRGRVYHADDYFAEVTEAERTRVYDGVKHLKAMGFKE